MLQFLTCCWAQQYLHSRRRCRIFFALKARRIYHWGTLHEQHLSQDRKWPTIWSGLADEQWFQESLYHQVDAPNKEQVVILELTYHGIDWLVEVGKWRVSSRLLPRWCLVQDWCQGSTLGLPWNLQSFYWALWYFWFSLVASRTGSIWCQPWRAYFL